MINIIDIENVTIDKTSIKLELLKTMIIASGTAINKIENINIISCLFNTINRVDSGDDIKLKNTMVP